jgi:hypothetical protein
MNNPNNICASFKEIKTLKSPTTNFLLTTPKIINIIFYYKGPMLQIDTGDQSVKKKTQFLLADLKSK